MNKSSETLVEAFTVHRGMRICTYPYDQVTHVPKLYNTTRNLSKEGGSGRRVMEEGAGSSGEGRGEGRAEKYCLLLG